MTWEDATATARGTASLGSRPSLASRAGAAPAEARPRCRVLLLDNYDSFTFNLFHAFGVHDVEVDVRRNDALTVDEAIADAPDALVVSPGPCDPDGAGISVPLIGRAAEMMPVMGVCLGHQAIGQVFGGRVVRAPRPMHGRISMIHHDNTGVFRGLPDPFAATRYHSLVVERDSVPESLRINAWSEDGMVMGLAHRTLPVHGVQFHPESIETTMGGALLRNFVAIVREHRAA